jgi:methylmalonyl-CoA mutase
MQSTPYQPIHKVRFVTAASLYDGHDASINIMRRILQNSGVEVIHLGHNRSAQEIVNTAIQEDVQGIAITSYQGGHNEFFKYIIDLLKSHDAGHIKVFGGGGGTILPQEIEELMQYGVTKIYSPDNGRVLGLQGMINELVSHCDFETPKYKLENNVTRKIAYDLTLVESGNYKITSSEMVKIIPVIGITGTGGAGKSSTTDEILLRFLNHFPEIKIGVLSVDPSKRKTGGALLGDRIRMNTASRSSVFMRSFATRESNTSINKHLKDSIQVLKSNGFDLILVETAGIGQADSQITELSDLSIYIMTPEFGASTQLEKIDMIDYADIIVVNKSDKLGALDAIRDVKKQYQRSRGLFQNALDEMPVFGTIASQFNDAGMNSFFHHLIFKLNQRFPISIFSNYTLNSISNEKREILPTSRIRYLSEIVETIHRKTEEFQGSIDKARLLYQIMGTRNHLQNLGMPTENLDSEIARIKSNLGEDILRTIETWKDTKDSYSKEFFTYTVRKKEIKVKNHSKSLSGLDIPKVSSPKYHDFGDILNWTFKENFPGEFPFTSGVFPFKRTGEDPTRMFAGEGGPERTNKRFHYLSSGMPAKRLSTAFDSVTLYGENPDIRPDVYGKIGNSGVSVATLDDAKKLYSGFSLTNPSTSVSMTINGPAPMVLAFFLNSCIDQECEKYIKNHGLEESTKSKIKSIYDEQGLGIPTYNGSLPEGNDGLGLLLLGVSGKDILPREVYENIKKEALISVRGTVQADILKEDQAQNTCIFSTEFALKMMGDIQEYFSQNQIRNFYSVSISGYHMAEAGCNPITQLAFTLANGFTYVEYYLSRGIPIDEFAPNLSFFFSNGIDPEYSVIGRVSRRIWARAMKWKYKANERSQLLKYHIQTSGRSLHAQEIDFNDIRTTLQALYAIYDNCNSLHTNAYDEAITTPTEDSVRRAVAIQLIINKELGLAKNENPLQGSFIIEELTDLVEEAVFQEFNRLTDRGGVLGAMERTYQRNKIQEESMYYEHLKHSGEFPIIGVNTFLNKNGSPTIIPKEVIRSGDEEKQSQIKNLNAFHKKNELKAQESLSKLKKSVIQNHNIFEELMEASMYCSLGQMTNSLYEVGGQYRRNI